MSINESTPGAATPDIDQAMLLQAALTQLKQLADRVAVLEAKQANSRTTITHPSPPARGRDPYLHRQTGWQPTRR